VVFLVAPFTVGTEITDGLPDGPKEFIVRMSLKTALVGKGEHLVVNPDRVANTQYVKPTVYEFL
jgi:hypothetical protein